jgi:HSP20 family protein
VEVVVTLLHFDLFEPLVSQLARPTGFIPATDVAVSESDIVVTMDVPGLRQDDLTIDLRDGHLVVRGERRFPASADTDNLAHRERGYGSFERHITVPDGVDADAITANLDSGVLSLIIPKPEHLKPKAIAIGTRDGAEQRQLETAGTRA